MCTKGDQLKIGYVDRMSRETLEKRLEKTPSNAHCFAQGSSSMCWPILEGPMGTTQDAEELGMCAHGYDCRAGARGCYIGFCLGLPSGVPDCQNKIRHNSVKNLVRHSILSTYSYYSQSQGASFAPIWMTWGDILWDFRIPTTGLPWGYMVVV